MTRCFVMNEYTSSRHGSCCACCAAASSYARIHSLMDIAMVIAMSIFSIILVILRLRI